VSPAVGSRGTRWAEIDAGALRANTARLAALARGGAEVMAMVKANGYGHGAVTAATAAIAGGATRLGVSSVPEALELRAAGIAVPILNVGWSTPEEVPAAVAGDVDLTVYDADSVRVIAAAGRAVGRRARVHWKLDTGMGRLGTAAGEVEEMRAALSDAAPDLEVVALFTHFASADDASLDFTLEQHQRFVRTVDTVRGAFPTALLHCANSAALLRLPETHHDIVRPGIALYGYLPPNCEGLVALDPALQLRALVTHVKDVAAGASVGYGREWRAPRRARVATVAAGYADGVDRRNVDGGRVIVGGTVCPMVGRVSMDQVGVDVTEAGEVRAGDVATLIGSGGGHFIGAADIAAAIGTISNEVLCALSARVPRVPAGEVAR
jgi:alanine racemase